MNSQAQGGLIDVISASIESAEPLPIEAIGRPIGVRVDQYRMPSMQKVVERFSED